MDEKQVVVGPESAPEVYAQPGLIPIPYDFKVPNNGVNAADEGLPSPETPIPKYGQFTDNGYHLEGGGGHLPQGGQHLEDGTTTKKPSKKKWIWIGVVVAICVIIAAVVGGVVGSRNANGGTLSASATDSSGAVSGGGATTSLPVSGGTRTSSTTGPTSTAFSVRQNSRLAVTGWKSEQDNNVRLFYQDTEGRIRYSTLSSFARDGWSQSTALGLDADPGTPLATCSFVGRDPVHIELYYVDKSSNLRGQFFENSNASPVGGSGSASINNFPLRLTNARMACYVPYLMIQEQDGAVRALLWDEARIRVTEPSKAWVNQTLSNLRGSGGSGAAVVPITPQFLDSSALVYRRDDGTLGNFGVSKNGNLTGTSWNAARLSIPIPEKSSIGSFTVARSLAKDSTQVNTYILYQDETGIIRVVWQDTDGPWKGPETFPALDGADSGTDIACVTQAVWNAVGVTLGPVSDLNRCYFQSGGRIKEVIFDGTTWQDLGFVPGT